MKEIGERLKKARKNWGFTQKQLAEYLNITQSQVSRIENGTRTLKASQLESLSNLYLVDEEWILHGSGETHFNNKPLLCFLKQGMW